MEKAKIINGWIICPICGKRQFPLNGDEVIRGLKYRCRTSRASHEHFMIINYERKELR